MVSDARGAARVVYPSDSGNANPTGQATLTLFTSARRPLCKRFSVNAGQIQKQAVADLYDGTAVTVAAPTAAALNALLDGLNHRQAVSAGVLKHGQQTKITTAAKEGQSGGASRSLRNFTFPAAPGWLLWDYDDKTMPNHVRARVEALGGPVKALLHLWPEAKGAACVIRPSSSDGVSAPGVAEINSAGLHGFFLVNDVSRSREILETLQARAWAEGLAWIALSKSGAQLVRSVVDIAVGSPERLIFEAPPILEAPVTRKARKPVIREGYALTAPQLTPEQTAQAQEAERAARHEISPQAAEAEAVYIEDRAQDNAKRTGRPIDEARQHVRQMLQGTVLADDHLLQLKDGSYLTVGEILDRSDLWDRQSIPDPVEGLAYGGDKATLLLKPRPGKANDKPVLLSHAHGIRTRYTFARYEFEGFEAKEPRKDIAPFYPAPTDDRDEAIDAHSVTCRGWGNEAIPAQRAIAWIRRRYAELDKEAPGHKARQREIRKEAQRIFGLGYLPSSKVTKDTPLPCYMLTGAQGVGKTAALVGPNGGDPIPGVLHDARGIVSLMLLPDLAMAEEARRRYDANAPENAPLSVVIRGRSAADPDAQGETMCRLPDIARKVVDRGESVKTTLCSKCPFKDQCGYLVQENRVERVKDDPAGAVIFGAHEYAHYPLPADARPALVVYDERPRDMAVGEVTVTLDALGETLPFEGSEAAFGKFAEASEEADAAEAQLRFIRPLMIALRDAAQNAPDRLMDYLRTDKGVDRNMVAGAIAGLGYFESKTAGQVIRRVLNEASFAELGGKPFNVENRLNKEIDAIVPKITRALRTVFKALLQEIEGLHPQGVGVVASKVPNRHGSREMVKGVRAVLIREMHHVEDVPLLHLDGTGDIEMSRMVFGSGLELHEHRVERNARITQVTGHTFSKAYITGMDARGKPWEGEWRRKSQKLRDDLIAAIARQPNAAVFSSKTVRTALGMETDPRAGHFGALRGRNDWENYDTGFVIGREQPAPWDIERIARAYAAKAGDGFTPAMRYDDDTRGVRGHDGTADVIDVKRHPDPWGDRVLRQIREKEIEQAIDRLRLIHNVEPKEIYILSPVVGDWTVDRVMDWQDFRQGGTRIERALNAHGVLPLRGAECARLLPSIWSNQRAAERDLKDRELNATNGNKNILFTECRAKELTLCSYVSPTKQGQRRVERQAVVAGPPDKAQSVLERLTGALDAFEVLEHLTDEQATTEAVEAARIEAEAREERAAIAEHDGGLSRENAQRVAAGLPPLPEPIKPTPVRPQDKPEIPKVAEVIPLRRRQTGT